MTTKAGRGGMVAGEKPAQPSHKEAAHETPPRPAPKRRPMTPDDPRHGTVNGYKNLGCRCPDCRKAHSVHYRDRAHRLGYRIPREEYLRDAIRHGIGRYRKGCRCDECRAASAAAKRRHRAKHSEESRAYDRAYWHVRQARKRAKQEAGL